MPERIDARHRALLARQTVVVFDVETTGMSPDQGARVVEIGAVKLTGGREQERFSRLIAVEVPIPAAVQAVHGITPAMLVGEAPASEVIPAFHAFVGNAPVVAHNAPFDLRFITHECSLCGLTFANRSYCTLALSRQLHPHLPSHKLGDLGRHFFGTVDEDYELHRALDDAALTARLWLHLCLG